MTRSDRRPVITLKRGRMIASIQPNHLRPPWAIWVSPFRSILRAARPAGSQGSSRPMTIWKASASIGSATTWGTP